MLLFDLVPIYLPACRMAGVLYLGFWDLNKLCLYKKSSV
jgi:hypothetical protein